MTLRKEETIIGRIFTQNMSRGKAGITNSRHSLIRGVLNIECEMDKLIFARTYFGSIIKVIFG